MLNAAVLINYVVRELERNLFIRALFFKVRQRRVRRLEVNHVKRELPRRHLGTELIPQDNRFLATIIRSVNLDPLALVGSPTCPRSVIFAGIYRFRNILYKINSCADPVISLYAGPAQFLKQRFLEIFVLESGSIAPAFLVTAFQALGLAFFRKLEGALETFAAQKAIMFLVVHEPL